jgi:hypothetical protein
MPKSFVFSVVFMVIVILSFDYLAGVEEDKRDEQASKKAFNTPGVVKVAYAPECGRWSYPLRLDGRKISFDVPGRLLKAQVRRGGFWYAEKMKWTARTFVSGVESIRFCAPHPSDKRAFSITWH